MIQRVPDDLMEKASDGADSRNPGKSVMCSWNSDGVQGLMKTRTRTKTEKGVKNGEAAGFSWSCHSKTAGA